MNHWLIGAKGLLSETATHIVSQQPEGLNAARVSRAVRPPRPHHPPQQWHLNNVFLAGTCAFSRHL